MPKSAFRSFWKKTESNFDCFVYFQNEKHPCKQALKSCFQEVVHNEIDLLIQELKILKNSDSKITTKVQFWTFFLKIEELYLEIDRKPLLNRGLKTLLSRLPSLEESSELFLDLFLTKKIILKTIFSKN